MASPPSTSSPSLGRSPSAVRRQAYHLPTRVISPPPEQVESTFTSQALPRTPPQLHHPHLLHPAVTLTPPSLASSRRSPTLHGNHVNSPASHQQQQLYAENDLTTFEMAQFPLPPSSPGSRSSPRSPGSPFQHSPRIQQSPPFQSNAGLSNYGTPRHLTEYQSSQPAFHQPPEDVRLSPASIARSFSPKPLYLPSLSYNAQQLPPQSDEWHEENTHKGSPQLARPVDVYSPASTSRQHTANRLLPSPMPLPTNDTDERPFRHDKEHSAFSPPDTAATDSTFPPPISPKDSLDDENRKKKEKKPKGPPRLFKPTISLLFSLSSRKDKLILLLPACIFSIGAGIMPPIMTFVLGDAFDLFTVYQAVQSYQATLPPSIQDMSQANHDLKQGMITVTIKLIILGCIIVALTTASLALWVWHGEKVAKRLRRTVYLGVARKPMAWFDLGMGKRIGDSAGQDNNAVEENESSGGLMGRFTTEIDNVRMAVAASTGRLVTSIATAIAGIAVGFWHSWQLTLMILAIVPILAASAIIVEVVASPRLSALRIMEASIASRVERSTGAISTVKAYNAEKYEQEQFEPLIKKNLTIFSQIVNFWGIRSGSIQFLFQAVFIVGFWFGNYLVTSGKKTAAEVTTAFFAVLLGSGSLEAIIPGLNRLDKAKIAMAALLETAADVPDDLSKPTSTTDSMKTVVDKLQITHIVGGGNGASPPTSPTSPMPYVPIQPDTRRGRHRRTQSKVKQIRDIKKIHPSRFTGELALHNVTFHYPSRPAPAPPALNKVTMYLPAKDTTYIVGGSGSGKSTIGALLLGLYKPDNGRIEADEQGIEWLDEHWLRGHVGMVSQGASVIFDGTVHENVALGVVGQTGDKKRRPEDVTRAEVIQACKIALFHDFVKELPDGYDTILSGEKGASLSGGQRQRLALARAYLKDPTVLILDEATSALDTVSRSLVCEAVKRWRRNKTTIIITHDLSPITDDDFVYVMRDGSVVEQGYRRELENSATGWFRHLAYSQASAPEQSGAGMDEEDEEEELIGGPNLMVTPPRENRLSSLVRRISFSPGNAFEPEATGGRENLSYSGYKEFQQNQRQSRLFVEEQQERRRSPSPSPANSPSLLASPSMQMTRSHSSQRAGLPALSPYTGARPKSMYGSPGQASIPRNSSYNGAGLERAIASSPARHTKPSPGRADGSRDSWYQLKEVVTRDVEAKESDTGSNKPEIHPMPAHQSLFKLLRIIFPLLPNKFYVILAFIGCAAAGFCTPLFSFQFSQLITALSAPGTVNVIQVAATALGIAAANGLLDWMTFTGLSRLGARWVYRMQKEGYEKVLLQDKAWFDEAQNASTSLMTALVKDSTDANGVLQLVGINIIVVFAMLMFGIIWAFVVGWQLTLIGLSLSPLFGVSLWFGSRLLNKYERINRAQREECAKRFFTSVSNVKAIRSMSLEPVLHSKFEDSVKAAYHGGTKSAFWTGFGAGIIFLVMYAAQAIMLVVGALFIINGSYTFGEVMQVFTLLILSISTAAAILGAMPHIAKIQLACAGLLRIHSLSTETTESQGRMTFPVSGRIVFDKVSFTYPSRSDVRVLDDVSFEVQPGECVAIVGPSGSGKSTVAALLQRLYDPADGMVRIDGRPTTRIDVKYLRDHVAVVSQTPALFDMSIADNITYGRLNVPLEDVIAAAKAAHVHDFVMSLPEGYDTHLGENAALISGGQAQRLQIARALLRPREILLGDEITSALDTENQEAVMRTLMDVKEGRTTVLITHTLAIMQLCDRLIVMDKGRVVQQGSFQQLQADSKGLFASLARAGEWNL